jgi:hypothetical protein
VVARERETNYMLGMTAVFAPSPLGGGARGAPRPHRIGWFCGRTRPSARRGVGWAVAWGLGGKRGRGGRAGALFSRVEGA